MHRRNLLRHLGEDLHDGLTFERFLEHGFPQIEEFNDDVFISWTDNSQANKIVKVTKIPVSVL